MRFETSTDKNNAFCMPLWEGLSATHGLTKADDFFGVYAFDGDELIGGAQGNASWDWFYLRHMWVKNQKQGLGTQLMNKVEDHVRQNKKVGVHLSTFDFQARPFYEKLGFKLLGELPHCCNGHTMYMLMKKL